MLAIQMIGIHLLSCQCLSNATASGNMKYKSENIYLSSKLTKTFVAQMDALKRYRNTSIHQQVNVNNGGKAIVGNNIHNN